MWLLYTAKAGGDMCVKNPSVYIWNQFSSQQLVNLHPDGATQMYVKKFYINVVGV